MGAKFATYGPCVPAKCIKGDFSYKLGTKEYAIHIEALRFLVFEEQCNFFYPNPEILSILHNEKYTVVLRRSGYGTIYLKNGLIVLKHFHHATKLFEHRPVIQDGGFLRNASKYDVTNRPINLYTIDKRNVLLFVENDPFSFSFNVKESEGNMLYMKQVLDHITYGYATIYIDHQYKRVYSHVSNSLQYELIGNLAVGYGTTLLL